VVDSKTTPEGTTLPEMDRPVKTTDPEFVTVTAMVPCPWPFGTARLALTWTCAVTLRLHRGDCKCLMHPRSVSAPAGPDQAPRSRFQQEAFVSPQSLLADLTTLSDRIPLVRYAIRVALAEIQSLACLPLSHPEASLPWKSPGARSVSTFLRRR